MIRFAALIALCATPLAAQEDNPLCTVSGEIVQAAVEARAAGTQDAEAARQISKTLTGDKEAYQPAVGPLVSWVYTLPEEQLAEDVAGVYLEACLAQ